MATMDAVEIANGERRALRRTRHVPPGADNVHHPSFDLALLAGRPAVDHHHGLALEHGLAVDGAVASKRRARLLGIKPGDAKRGYHFVANIDGRSELHALREIDAARPWKLGAEHRGEQAPGQEAMGDALLENRAGGEIVAQMDWVDVAGEVGE